MVRPMRMITTALLITGLSASAGCVLVHPRPRRAAASCPPGHRWSDGRCHATGKGHDPDKKHGKRVHKD